MMDKNCISSEIDEKEENGAGSVGENCLDTTVKNNTMTAESQDFHLVDFDESQTSQTKTPEHQQEGIQSPSGTSTLKESDAEDKSDGARDNTIKAVQDGGEIVADEKEVVVEAEKSDNEIMTPNTTGDDDDDDDDDIVHSTPPEQLYSPTKRQLLGAMGPHKRKIDDSDEPAAKIARSMEDDIIPETQESPVDANEELCGAINNSDKQEKQSDSTKTNIADDIDDNSKLITTEDVTHESLQMLSQALESVLNDEEKIETDESTVTMKEEPKKIATDTEIVRKSENEEKQIIESIKKPDESSEKMNSSKDVEVKSSSHNGTEITRMSIEVIYEKSLAPPPTPKELVEIDEDGEKIVLDSSHEDVAVVDCDVSPEKKRIIANVQLAGNSKDTIEKKLTNGNEHTKSKSDTDCTENISANVATDTDRSIDSRNVTNPIVTQKIPELMNLISDSEEDSFLNDEKAKIKTIPIEKEIMVLMKVKCLVHVDEVSKEITSKEIIFSSCESAAELQSSRRRTSSALGLADISDGKDSVSPSSVTSNPRPYPLNPRFSTTSMASSSSSSSSGSFKLPLKDTVHFSLPRGVPKHAKKAPEPHTYDDIMAEKLKKEWKNVNLLTASLLNFLNSELMSTDFHNGIAETTNNTLEHFRSSTPETLMETPLTPKSTGKVRLTKRTRGQSIRNSSSNGLMKKSKHSSEKEVEKKEEIEQEKQESDSANESLISAASTPSRQSARSLSILRNQTPVYDPSDALIGKQCFAKWGDNNYYPGIVVSKSKTKFRINFLDGLNKLLMEDFVVVMPPILPVGLSIYAAVTDDSYGSCGIITDVDKNNDVLLYIVETDEGEKLRVSIRDIFLTSDQVLILKESMNEDIKSPPSTPHLGKITLDNIVEGNRRNKSLVISTPKSTRGKSKANIMTKSADVKPSGSGVPSKINFQRNSDTDLKTSDDDEGLGSIQAEIIGTSSEYTTKGPQNRLKGKARSKKKVDDQETIALLGPIPEEGSTLFKGMNFILTCASLESLDKYKMDNKVDSNSESGTDLEQDWNSTPFIRDRLTAQITAGGGKIYEKFQDIPKDEYKITKLITNVPNITAKSLQCLSAGIHSWNHKWVIRSCLDNKLVNLNQEKLPAGWSLDRKSYIEMSDRPTDKPFNHIIIAVPKIVGVEESTKFWTQIIKNAGGTVRLIENPSDNFVEATAVLTNRQCPSWIELRAQSENIPLVSTTWIVQCLVAGVITSHETHVAYFHHYIK